MTDREPTVPADLSRPLNFRPQVDHYIGDPSPNSHVEPAKRGDFPPMSLTLASRPSSRSPTAADLTAGSVRAWLGQIASANSILTPFAPSTLPGSQTRNPMEAEAAARAAGCPDLFVIHAPEQTARERVIADIAWSTAYERVLVLSPDSSTADRIVDRLIKLNVSAVRALADDENPARPSPAVSRATSTAIAASQLEQFRAEMTAAVARAAERLNAFDKTISLHVQIESLAKRGNELEKRIADLNAQCEGVERQVRSEARGTENTPFAAVLTQRKSERQIAVDEIVQRRHSAQSIHKEKESLVADLRKLSHEIAHGAGKKSGFISRLLGRPKPTTLPIDQDKQLRDAEQELSEIATTIAALQRDFQVASSLLEEEAGTLIQAEIALRNSAFKAQLGSLMSELDRLQSERDSAIHALGSASTRQELSAAREDAERELASAKQNTVEQERTARESVKRMLGESRIVVGTPGSLQADPIFEANRHDLDSRAPFGLLVLDRAEELTEHDFVRLTKLAARWVLVGDVSVSEGAQPRGVSSRPTPIFSRNGRAAELPFSTRLAQSLDRERWTHEPDRLVCRLEHLAAENRRNLVREPLLDRPEIELRFNTTSDGEPVLVEVAFPPGESIASAKTFLYRQLGEILLRPSGEAAWHSTDDTFTACWPTVDRAFKSSEAAWIDLEPGVREKIVGTGTAGFTAAVAFDATHGWNPEKAAQWLNEHLTSETLGRFASVARR